MRRTHIITLLLFVMNMLNMYAINTRNNTTLNNESLYHEIQQLKQQVDLVENQIEQINAKIYALDKKNDSILRIQKLNKEETSEMISDVHTRLNNKQDKD